MVLSVQGAVKRTSDCCVFVKSRGRGSTGGADLQDIAGCETMISPLGSWYYAGIVTTRRMSYPGMVSGSTCNAVVHYIHWFHAIPRVVTRTVAATIEGGRKRRETKRGQGTRHSDGTTS